jgi:hypothetical protein
MSRYLNFFHEKKFIVFAMRCGDVPFMEQWYERLYNNVMFLAKDTKNLIHKRKKHPVNPSWVLYDNNKRHKYSTYNYS